MIRRGTDVTVDVLLVTRVNGWQGALLVDLLRAEWGVATVPCLYGVVVVCGVDWVALGVRVGDAMSMIG